MNIIKRPETGSSNYYIRFEHRGKKFLRSTGTPVMAAAKVKAKRILDSIVNGDGKEAERLKLKNDYASLEEIVERYRTRGPIVAELGSKTVIGNVSALRSIVRTVLGDADADNLTRVKASALSAELLDAFKAAKRAGAKGFAELERAKRSANSTMTQARSLFSKPVLPIYDGLKLPDLAKFKAVAKFGLSESVGFRPIPCDVLTAMEKAARDGLRVNSPAQYLGYLMAIRLGMRACEIVAARWEWLERFPTGTQMAILTRAYFAPKGAEGRVPVSDQVLEEMKALGGPVEGGSGFILPAASPTERNEAIYRGLSGWVRQFLPDREKSVHELRKHAGSIVVTQTQSIVQAQRFLRHRSVATTERHYATLLDQIAPLTSAHWDAKQEVA